MKIKSISILLLTFLCACATTPRYQPANIQIPVETQFYKLNFPEKEDWKGWSISKKENETIVFKQIKKWPLTGEVLAVTTIAVMRDFLLAEREGLGSEDETANNVMDLEENVLREKGEKKGKYTIKEITRETVKSKNKKLYVMNYKLRTKTGFKGYFYQCSRSDSALYLYFPSEFKNDHVFYRFQIDGAYKPGRFAKPNLKKVLEVIDAFEIKK